MRLRTPRRHVDEDQRILPLINVVFLLLIFFMVAGQLSAKDPINVAPPESDSQSEMGEQHLRILVSADGRVIAAGEPIDLGAITNVIRERLDASGSTEVHVKADGDADSKFVIDVIERVKSGGATKIRLLTTTRRAS